MKQTIQIENIGYEDFKNEIIKGVVDEIKKISRNANSEPEPDKLLSRTETANLLSISLVSLWSMTKENKIPAYTIGKNVRYKKSDVLKALQLKPNNHNCQSDE